MLLSIFLQAVNDTATAAATNAASAEMPDNLWKLAAKGGVVMIPIGIMFVASIYLAIERWLTIHKASKIEATFMMSIKDMVLNDNIMGADALCKRTNSFLQAWYKI